MSDTSARLLRLLSLLQARRDWPGDALAERLEVSARTVRRDVDRLRELGYPVRATKGPDGGYRLDAGADLPPLLFDDEQAVAVAVALQTATGSVVGIEEGALRALATVRQVMPARLRQRIDALQVTTVARDAGAAAGRHRAADRHRRRGAGPRGAPVRLPDAQLDRRGTTVATAAAGRATPPGDLGRTVVPGLLGPRPERLANLPGGPDGAENCLPVPGSRRESSPAATSPATSTPPSAAANGRAAASSSCTRRPPRSNPG